nr:MotA/TolQ/ExbB proton channel family protein [uncultured Duganella sp.]
MNHGLLDVWQQGDFVSRSIVVVLISMSMLSWAVIVFKGSQLARLKRQSRRIEGEFWATASLEHGEDMLRRLDASSPYLALVATAFEVNSSRADTRLENAMSPDEWLARSLRMTFDDCLTRLQSGLAMLASIGSTSPFIGLFGTVWGIYHAMQAISASGQSDIAQVAGPVGEALVMTAFGLFVAIPAVLGYNGITRGNRAVSHKLMMFTHDLQAYARKTCWELGTQGNADVVPGAATAGGRSAAAAAVVASARSK